MTGTSLKQVEETYWHLNEEQLFAAHHLKTLYVLYAP